MRQTFNWTRYWHRHDQTPPISPDGFLHVLSTPFTEPDALVRFGEVRTVPCLVMLGEPGIGKSHAVTAACESVVSQSIDSNDERARQINLKEYSETELVRELDAILHEFAAADYNLHLFLDSLDEAKIRISTIVYILHRRLEKLSAHAGRLYLRIACRTADWPAAFEEKLRSIWEADDVKVYVLTPLQRQDVAVAAYANNIDSDEFLRQVLEKEVGALAASPITLDLLIRMFVSESAIAENKSSLYFRGCLELCRERERTHETKDKLQPEQRLQVAARLAACTLLTNSYGVGQHRATAAKGEESIISVEEVAGGTETVNGESFPVWEDAIRETLDTPLFQGTGYRFWAHHTYGEFLAALYLKDLSANQIRGLIFHSDGKLVPQLREVAAWLASMQSGIFYEVLRQEPDALLRSDVITSDTESKIRLVEALLKQIEEQGWPQDANNGSN